MNYRKFFVNIELNCGWVTVTNDGYYIDGLRYPNYLDKTEDVFHQWAEEYLNSERYKKIRNYR